MYELPSITAMPHIHICCDVSPAAPRITCIVRYLPHVNVLGLGQEVVRVWYPNGG
jgi:hypothetical protein